MNPVNDFAVIYDATTGEHIGNFSGPPGTAAQLQILSGQSIMIVPQAAWLTPPDLAIIKADIADKVDAEAEDVRARYITLGAGQAMTYLTKEAEATAYLADNTAPTPFLTAEAAATSTTVAALAAVVHARAVAWQTIGSKIEAARMGAKAAITAATNLAEIAAARVIDWTSVTA